MTEYSRVCNTYLQKHICGEKSRNKAYAGGLNCVTAHTTKFLRFEIKNDGKKACARITYARRFLLTLIFACVKISAITMKKLRMRISVWQFLSLGYLLVILSGSALLSFPFATSDGTPTSYINALFTSASATCVTGLTPFDTGVHWSVFGQLVILFLIQTGGLGFMTFVSVVFLMLRRKMGLYERKALMSATGGSNKLNGVSRLIKRVFIGTAIFEFMGACLLCYPFCRDYGGIGVYYSLWHSISAFCNAGFDLVGVGGTSLSAYATDPLVCLTICALIIFGGMGFLVWGDFIDCKARLKKLQLNTKIVLLMTCLLLIVSTLLFLGFEWNNPAYENYNFWQKLLCSIFNAVSPRTAGFFTTDPATLSESGYLLTVMLMFIGGSSGSTAGGIKVGTFAVIIMGMISVFRGRKDINIGKKRIEHSLLSQALAIFTACLMLVMIAVLIICAADPLFYNPETGVGFKEALFECVSALGTVGLTLGITPELGIVSKLVIIVLMYAGRVGILTLALALGEKRTASAIRNPVDTLMIG